MNKETKEIKKTKETEENKEIKEIRKIVGRIIAIIGFIVAVGSVLASMNKLIDFKTTFNSGVIGAFMIIIGAIISGDARGDYCCCNRHNRHWYEDDYNDWYYTVYNG